ncbi:MAG: hypothetical protein IT262_03615 [Saprospiraceae bacterium]|nr:hypothetical protein [Saprospiraceae bacterium]
MRILFTISLLAVLLYKISEPLVMSLHYAWALETPLPKAAMNDEQIEIKVHAPLPYTGNFEETDPIQKCFKLGDEFYNVVERRYENDTLYFTLQRNISARDKFDALSSILNTLSSDEQSNRQQPLSHHAPSAKDFITVFSPMAAPAVVRHYSPWENDLKTSFWHYNLYLPTGFLSVVVPPPDCA